MAEKPWIIVSLPIEGFHTPLEPDAPRHQIFIEQCCLLLRDTLRAAFQEAEISVLVHHGKDYQTAVSKGGWSEEWTETTVKERVDQELNLLFDLIHHLYDQVWLSRRNTEG